MLVLSRRIGESIIIDATGDFPTNCMVERFANGTVELTFRSCSGTHFITMRAGQTYGMQDAGFGVILFKILKATASRVSLGIEAHDSIKILRKEES